MPLVKELDLAKHVLRPFSLSEGNPEEMAGISYVSNGFHNEE